MGNTEFWTKCLKVDQLGIHDERFNEPEYHSEIYDEDLVIAPILSALINYLYIKTATELWNLANILQNDYLETCRLIAKAIVSRYICSPDENRRL